MSWLLGTILPLMATLPVRAEEPGTPGWAKLQRAAELAQARDLAVVVSRAAELRNWRRVMELTDLGIPDDPDQPHLRYWRGVALERLGRPFAASLEYQRAMDIAGKDPSWKPLLLRHLARAYQAAGYCGEAAKAVDAYTDFERRRGAREDAGAVPDLTRCRWNPLFTRPAAVTYRLPGSAAVESRR
jgi:hypothetical protein